jgi:hypothetical protein
MTRTPKTLERVRLEDDIDPPHYIEKLQAAASGIPPVVARSQSTPQPAALQPAAVEQGRRAERTVQINFRGSEGLAWMIDQEAKKEGISIRQFIARALQQAGYPVPEADLRPAAKKRQWSERLTGGQGRAA